MVPESGLSSGYQSKKAQSGLVLSVNRQQEESLVTDKSSQTYVLPDDKVRGRSVPEVSVLLGVG